MIIIDCEQGSNDWFALRAGISTASEFSRIITLAGKPSEQRQKYLYQLAGERLTGVPMETYHNGAMLRGKELEGEARQAYELITDNGVQQVGFCFPDEDKKYGCSPDGLIGDDGGLEIKCPTLPVAVEYLDKGVLPSAYCQQVQGALLVTGRNWWDFFSYYPGLPPFIIRIERDDKFLKSLKMELQLFCEALDCLVERIQ